MLDEAARYLDVRPPHLDTETLRRCLDPDHFIASHSHLGGTVPEENRRLLTKRREPLAAAFERQRRRKAQVTQAVENLKKMTQAGQPPEA